MVTTMHTDHMTDTGKKDRTGAPIQKSDVLAYDRGMGGVNLSDHIAVFYKASRKTVKW